MKTMLMDTAMETTAMVATAMKSLFRIAAVRTHRL